LERRTGEPGGERGDLAHVHPELVLGHQTRSACSAIWQMTRRRTTFVPRRTLVTVNSRPSRVTSPPSWIAVITARSPFSGAAGAGTLTTNSLTLTTSPPISVTPSPRRVSSWIEAGPE